VPIRKANPEKEKEKTQLQGDPDSCQKKKKPVGERDHRKKRNKRSKGRNAWGGVSEEPAV